MLADQVTETWQPSNEAERVAVREQLEKLLLTSHFSASRRYPIFLRFVLQHTLAGESVLLKERTLALDLLGRAREYHTARDPIVLLLSTASCALWHMFKSSPAEQFWAPFVKSKDPVLFCIADQNQYAAITLLDAADPLRKTTLKDNLITIVIDDVNPLIGIAGILQNSGRSYRVQGQSNTTLTDLRRGPSVLIGAYDNSWTLRL